MNLVRYGCTRCTYLLRLRLDDDRREPRRELRDLRDDDDRVLDRRLEFLRRLERELRPRDRLAGTTIAASLPFHPTPSRVYLACGWTVGFDETSEILLTHFGYG